MVRQAVGPATDRPSHQRRSDRDLVAALRSELAAIDPARRCDRDAEAAGLGPGVQRQSGLARLSIRLGRSRAPQPFDWSVAADHCRFAYLRGLFLAAGSLSLAGSRTHLEFVVDADQAPVLVAWLADVELPASWRLRRGRGVVTWKSSEIVVTFLRRIGAGASLLELEARQVSRSMRGDLNRVINAESANLQRAVAAAWRQLSAIDQLEAEGRLAHQPDVVRVVAAARRETPESTTTELAERLELNRSAVQRALQRLERIALYPADDERPRRRTRRPEASTAGLS